MSTDTVFSVGPQDRQRSHRKWCTPSRGWANGQWCRSRAPGSLPRKSPPPDLRVVLQLSHPPFPIGQPRAKRRYTCLSCTHTEVDRFVVAKAVVEASDLQRRLQQVQAEQQYHASTHKGTTRGSYKKKPWADWCPPGNNSNHPGPTRKQQQPSRAHQQINVTAQNPPRTSTRKQQQGALYQNFPSFLRSSTKIYPSYFWPSQKKPL